MLAGRDVPAQDKESKMKILKIVLGDLVELVCLTLFLGAIFALSLAI